MGDRVDVGATVRVLLGRVWGERAIASNMMWGPPSGSYWVEYGVKGLQLVTHTCEMVVSPDWMEVRPRFDDRRGNTLFSPSKDLGPMREAGK